MTTTFKDLIQAEGWEPLKKYDLDKWLGGLKHIHHVSSLMFFEDHTLLLWYKEYIEYAYSDEVTEYKDINGVFSYSDELEVIYADSLEEARADHKYIKDKKDLEDNARINKALASMELFGKQYSKMRWKDQNKIDEIILKEERFEAIRGYSHRWHNNDDKIDCDVMFYLHSIFISNAVQFNDRDNQDINTILKLSNVNKIELDIVHNDKSAIAIEMNNGDEYFIYEEKNADVYKAMYILYSGGLD